LFCSLKGAASINHVRALPKQLAAEANCIQSSLCDTHTVIRASLNLANFLNAFAN